MTDPHHPPQPYQQNPVPQPPPHQYQPAEPSPPNPQPTGFITPEPAKPNRKPLLIIVAAVAALMLAAAGYAVYDGFIKEDSGVAACKAMRDGKQADGSAKGSDDDKFTVEEYQAVRKVFEDSRHEDIREHGTALMDLAWQVSQLDDANKLGALAFIGPMSTHISGLQTACANQGVIVNLNTK